HYAATPPVPKAQCGYRPADRPPCSPHKPANRRRPGVPPLLAMPPSPALLPVRSPLARRHRPRCAPAQSSSCCRPAKQTLRFHCRRRAGHLACYTTEFETEIMLLAREFVAYISRELVKKLTPVIVETSNPQAVSDLIQNVILDELMVEDRLNDEVREILGQYSDYMRREGVSYQEMFRRIKNTLMTQRKVIRASGRDAGDNMKLSRDKITDMSHKIVDAMRKSRDLRIKRDRNDVRLEIVRDITEILTVEERVDRASRQKIRSQKREIPEGSEEWDLLHKRYYAE